MLWLIDFNRTCVTGLSGCIGDFPRQGYDSGRQFCGVVAAWLGDATKSSRLSLSRPSISPWVMVMVATKQEFISACSKLKVRQVTAIKLNHYFCTFCCDLVGTIESGCRC